MWALQPERKYLTEERVQEWRGLNGGFKLPEPAQTLRFLYELCWSMVHGDLPIPKFRAILDSIEFSDRRAAQDVASFLADIVAQMGQDLTMPSDCRARLTKLAKLMVELSLVPLKFFHERCEEEFLWESEMIKIKAPDLKSKEVRVNTRLLYQQTKFNLLREESEGYSKLVTLLCHCHPEASIEKASAATVSTIKSLIGHFDLDPNRVFDVVLECFELQPDNKMFLDLIPIFPRSHAAQILGFKFQYYQRTEVNSLVPFGLYRLAAALVKEDFIDLESIYAHLLPKDEEAFEHYEVFSMKRVDEANKIGKINLAATGKDLMDEEKQGDVTIDLFAALDMESEAVEERLPELENNQSLGLLLGFLSVDDWVHARILLDQLSPLNPVAHIQICQELFRVIEKAISSAYVVFCQIHVQGGGFDTIDANHCSVSTLINLPGELFQMLSSTGPYLHRDAALLQKVCRVLRGYYLSAKELISNSSNLPTSDLNKHGGNGPHLHFKEVRLKVEEALGICLLPSLQLIPANPAVSQEIWELMSLLPYEVRYRLYGEWEKEDEQMPMLLAARQTAKLDTRRILKRLAKENLKQLGRMVAKLAHSNPMTVLRTIVHQIEAYKDMIAPVVDAFKYLTQLEYDVLEYVVIERLAQGGREKLKDDGLNLSDWLQSLASFWGHLCKKYPSMELRGLFQYLVNQLKKGVGIELVLLQELIQQMANVQYTENVTEEQLDAMAGSETLRYQATSFGITRNNKALVKSTNRLRDSLLPKEEPKLAVPLLLLIAQYRSMVVINANAPYIKMVSEQFDRCHGALLQYVEFLNSAISPSSAYAQLIPSLSELVHMYHLDPEVAFLIYRPVMRLFKCTTESEGEIFWPCAVIEEDNVTTTEKEAESVPLPAFILDAGPAQKPFMWSDLLDAVQSILPSRAWKSLSPDLYATFWGLSLYDLFIPKNRYESEIGKQHAALRSLEELSDNSSSAIAKRKKEKERIQELLDRLTNELKNHEQHVAMVWQRLAHDKDTWLSSCPDTLKINMEFLQRCIFPRCIFSMPDAVYCAKFVHTLHSLGTPFFNTVNHLDVLICKTVQPMICCCTEYEAGRLGRFLCETLKMAYHWKSDESIYERECSNMPGFAVYYRFPNSTRVTYGQFVKVHWKWSGRITRLLIQCLESNEYMEIRNALILLTKISSVFPVTRKSGINLEKRVAKIKGDEREDLKVLATGVTAALASRKSSWVTEEEFCMGYIDLKPAASPAKSLPSHPLSATNDSVINGSQHEGNGLKTSNQLSLVAESLSSVKELPVRAKAVDGKLEGYENSQIMKTDLSQKVRGGPFANGADVHSQSTDRGSLDESTTKVVSKACVESEAKLPAKRNSQGTSSVKVKQEQAKDDLKIGKLVGKSSVKPSSSTFDREFIDERQGGASTVIPTTANGSTVSSLTKPSAKLVELRGLNEKDADTVSNPLRDDSSALKSLEKQQKRGSPTVEVERINKRRKGDPELKDGEEREKFNDARLTDKSQPVDPDKTLSNEHSAHKSAADKTKDKARERHEREHEKSRDRSMERHGRERSVERFQERGAERIVEKKDDRSSKVRYNDGSVEKSHGDDRFHGQSLPPPPPLPPNVVPQSVSASRREDESDRRVGSSRHTQRLSPRHEDKERRRSEENLSILQDDSKRRKEEEFRERKRDERDGLPNKAEDREKGNSSKENMDGNVASKRRKIKRDQSSTEGDGEYSLAGIPQTSLTIGSSQSYDARERGERKGAVVQRQTYVEENTTRLHGKEPTGKIPRREPEQLHEREWEEEKRLRAEAKRRHRK